jgi:Mg2+ and Co2+ transporter CorA
MECLGGHEKKDAQDWIYVHKKLSLWESRVRDLVDSAHCSITLIESTKSIEEARATRLLAILGTVFIPLSLVASILSMGGDFLPGNSQFWVYFVMSLPPLLLSLTIVFASPMVLKRVESWRNKPRYQRIEVTPTKTVPPGMA